MLTAVYYLLYEGVRPMESRIVYADNLEQFEEDLDKVLGEFEPEEIVDISYKVHFGNDHYLAIIIVNIE